jgi:hypothetical protein
MLNYYHGTLELFANLYGFNALAWTRTCKYPEPHYLLLALFSLISRRNITAVISAGGVIEVAIWAHVGHCSQTVIVCWRDSMARPRFQAIFVCLQESATTVPLLTGVLRCELMCECIIPGS